MIKSLGTRLHAHVLCVDVYCIDVYYCVFVQCGEVDGLVSSLREKVAASCDVSRERGLSLLELKHQLMLR